MKFSDDTLRLVSNLARLQTEIAEYMSSLSEDNSNHDELNESIIEKLRYAKGNREIEDE